MTESARKRSRGRPAIPREVQQERLISAALRVLEERGYDKVRVTDIVGEAGMSSRSFYEFFDSKEGMVVEIVRRVGRQFMEGSYKIRDELENPFEQMDAGLTLFLELFTLPPVDLVGLGGTAATQMQRVLGEYVRELAAMVHQTIVDAHRSGLVPNAPELVQIEVLFEGMLSLAVRYFSEGRGSELAELQPKFREIFVRVML